MNEKFNWWHDINWDGLVWWLTGAQVLMIIGTLFYYISLYRIW